MNFSVPQHPDTTLHPADFQSRQVESSRVFFFDQTDDLDFAVTGAGFERCRPDYRIDRPDFPWFLLEFVLAGRGRVALNATTATLQAGDFFLYGPGVEHHIASDPERPLHKYFAGFCGSEAAALLDELGLQPGTVHHCLRVEPIRAAFDTLIERGARHSKFARPLCAAILRQILYLAREDAVDAGSTDTRAFATFSRARDLIERRFLELATLEAVAAACDLDAPYLCRLFARFHDESPYQFLTRLKMRHAASLLLEENLSVKEAARAVGFPDPFHFSRVFKSVHRVPPSRFRGAMEAKKTT